MLNKSFVYKVLVSGHHIYADAHEAFNDVAVQICKVEQGTTLNDIPQQIIDMSPAPKFIPSESITNIS